ncbi:Hypothetical protein PHPALM_9349 [Phytophthora palmivora]|uniref:Uncharacterized protein n=1 Tax=Phytophthora palmivora TaxID=4796 RepID=A0A2P4Y7J3_9STRA|nr:Hypothetical protein PHPALM_9349 [Phytophthora palmivora]
MDLVDVLIVDVDDGEFIVGNDLLVALGIDVNRQLEQLSSNSEDEMPGNLSELEAVDMPVQWNVGFRWDVLNNCAELLMLTMVWRLELRVNPPARVPPLKVRLRDGVLPTKCNPRKYPPHIRKFLHEFNKRLVELGLSSPLLPVKKSAQLLNIRQSVDYRITNAHTEIMAAVIPILSLVVEHPRQMKHFGLFDFIKGFWHLLLAKVCQEWFSNMTDENIFTPKRVPQGFSDATTRFQKTMEECFASLLYKHILIWIDDILLHDPERIYALREMAYPTTAGELQQFIYGINWMRESIVEFVRPVAPFQRKLDAALADTKRTKRVATGIKIELRHEERKAFNQVKIMLVTSATLAFTDDESTACLLTDASDAGWAVILTQLDDFNPKMPVTKEQLKLLTCLSGIFTGSQLHWAVRDKVALPIVITCEKLDYLFLLPKPFRMFCDHRNLGHVFA